MSHSQTYNKDDRPLVALDWSFAAVHTTVDGEQVARWKNFGVFLDSLQVPHKIVAESSFESWDPQRRRDTIDSLREKGHELYVFRPKYTSRLRTQIPGLTKSDANDAKVIHMIATNGRHHLYPVPAVDEHWVRFRTEANRDWHMLRLTGQKDVYAKRAAELLGAYRTQEEARQQALGNGRAYSKTIMAVLVFCAERCTSRNEFERLIGLHGSAYPSLLRSDVHNHSMKHARNRGVSMSAYRRELRRTWRQLRAAIVAPDADETSTPGDLPDAR